MIARIDETYALTSNSHEYRLTNRLTGRHQTHYGMFSGIGFDLVARGLIKPVDIQGGYGHQSDLFSQLDQQFSTLCPDHATAVDRRAVIAFGKGRFRVEPNRYGDWTLLNPTRDLHLLTDQFKGEKIVLGYPTSLSRALHAAVVRAFRESNQTLEYTDLDTTLAALAYDILSDLSVSLDGEESIPLVSTDPNPSKPVSCLAA